MKKDDSWPRKNGAELEPRNGEGTAEGKVTSLRAERPLSRQIASEAFIRGVSTLSGVVVSSALILVQWLIYVDWLHRHGPLRLVGSLLAGVLTASLASHLLRARRRRKLEMLRRFETIARMNDRIRNALQAIECISYAADPAATTAVRESVNTVEGVLEEVLAEWHPPPAEGEQREREPQPPKRGTQRSA
jgi:hypothetical protein